MNKSLLGFSPTAGRGNQLDDAFESLFSNAENAGFDKGIVQAYPARSVIFKQDTQPQAVYLIEQGLVKLVRVVASGPSIIIGLRRRHWLIGAPSALLGQSYSFTAITVVTSSLRCIAAKDFLHFAKTDEQFSWYLHRLLAKQVAKQMKGVEAMNCLSAKDRLKFFLRDMIDDQNMVGSEPSNFSLPLTNNELAQLLAITPEHLCRVLKEMRQDGLMRCTKGVLTVTDPDGLL